GDIWVKGSRRYKNFDDYLIPEKDFDKFSPALPLPVSADSLLSSPYICHSYRQQIYQSCQKRAIRFVSHSPSGEIIKGAAWNSEIFPR
ncbi:hypothetical protein ACVEAC_005317, partial [Escherichia coli]